MADLKIYYKGSSMVVEYQGEKIISDFDIKVESDGTYTVVDRHKESYSWNILSTELKDEYGTLISDVNNYLNNNDLNSTKIVGSNLDAFGRLRVSELTTLFDLKQIHGFPSLFVDQQNINGGTTTHDSSDSSTSLSVSANGDRVVNQTFQKFNYQSGKSHLIMMTFAELHQETNVVKRAGYFSSSTTTPFNTSFDGLFLQSDSNGVSVNIYKNGTQIESETSFNGEDISDVDWSTSQILYLDFEWLGVGIVRWGLVRNGVITYFHTSRHDNLINGTYMNSPNKPLRWEIESTGGGGSFKYICASVNSEGSQNKIGKVLSDNIGTTHINANIIGDKYAVMGARLKSTDTDTLVDFLNFSLMGITNDNYYYEVYFNPTVAGTFTYNDVSNSSIQIAKADTGGTNTVTGGTLIDSGYITSANSEEFSIDNAIKLGASIDGVSDEFVLCVVPLTTGLDIYGSLTWRENQ